MYYVYIYILPRVDQESLPVLFVPLYRVPFLLFFVCLFVFTIINEDVVDITVC